MLFALTASAVPNGSAAFGEASGGAVEWVAAVRFDDAGAGPASTVARESAVACCSSRHPAAAAVAVSTHAASLKDAIAKKGLNARIDELRLLDRRDVRAARDN